MTQPIRCKACLHPRVRDIDKWLLLGRTAAQVSRKFGVEYASTRRHKNASHPKTEEQWAAEDLAQASVAPKGAPPVAQPWEGDAATVLREQVGRLKAVDTSQMSIRDRTAHEDLLRRATSDLNRAEGPRDLEGPAQEEARRLRREHEAIAQVLRKYPEAKAAVAAALRALR